MPTSHMTHLPSVNGFPFLTTAKETAKLTEFHSPCMVPKRSCPDWTLHGSSWRFIFDRFVKMLSLHIRHTAETPLYKGQVLCLLILNCTIILIYFFRFTISVQTNPDTKLGFALLKLELKGGKFKPWPHSDPVGCCYSSSINSRVLVSVPPVSRRTAGIVFSHQHFDHQWLKTDKMHDNVLYFKCCFQHWAPCNALFWNVAL